MQLASTTHDIQAFTPAELYVTAERIVNIRPNATQQQPVSTWSFAETAISTTQAF